MTPQPALVDKLRLFLLPSLLLNQWTWYKSWQERKLNTSSLSVRFIWLNEKEHLISLHVLHVVIDKNLSLKWNTPEMNFKPVTHLRSSIYGFIAQAGAGLTGDTIKTFDSTKSSRSWLLNQDWTRIRSLQQIRFSLGGDSLFSPSFLTSCNTKEAINDWQAGTFEQWSDLILLTILYWSKLEAVG